MNWFEPETLGKPPTPRFGHSINFCPQFGLLAVIGGKDDKSVFHPFFNDICLLNLTNMNWLKLRIFGITTAPSRAFHSSAIISIFIYSHVKMYKIIDKTQDYLFLAAIIQMVM